MWGWRGRKQDSPCQGPRTLKGGRGGEHPGPVGVGLRTLLSGPLTLPPPGARLPLPWGFALSLSEDSCSLVLSLLSPLMLVPTLSCPSHASCAQCSASPNTRSSHGHASFEGLPDLCSLPLCRLVLLPDSPPQVILLRCFLKTLRLLNLSHLGRLCPHLL